LATIKSHHTGLTVSDLEAQQAWYAAAFGFEARLEFVLPGGVRGAMLRTAGGAGVELFEVPDADPGLRAADPPAAMRRSGYGHVAVETDDLEEAYAAVVNAGGQVVWPPRQSPEPGRWMAFVHDPEGNLIELIGPAE
jgi:catechol 2,3-dioxygenase-like lactoylglutathione lyase family enzyme